MYGFLLPWNLPTSNGSFQENSPTSLGLCLQLQYFKMLRNCGCWLLSAPSPLWEPHLGGGGGGEEPRRWAGLGLPQSFLDLPTSAKYLKSFLDGLFYFSSQSDSPRPHTPPPSIWNSSELFQYFQWILWYFYTCFSPEPIPLKQRALISMLEHRPHTWTAAMASISEGLWTWMCISDDPCCHTNSVRFHRLTATRR